MALLWALLFVIVTSGMVVSHTAYMAARRGERDARHNRDSVADTFARSGLSDAVGWFHRRSTQPITKFDPVYDPAGDPPRVETIDPTIGLVREFQINGNLHGRYEVRHEAVSDISSQRGQTPGSAWEIGVRAFVFRQRDPSKAFNEAPNQLVATRAMTSELRWLHINPPAPAALCADKPSDVTVGDDATVEGGPSVALAYQDPAAIGESPSSPTISGTVEGTPSQLAAPAYDSSADRVFGMRLDELRAYSDVIIDEGSDNANRRALIEWLESGRAPANGEGQVIYVHGLRLIGELTLSNVLLVIEGNLNDSAGHQTRIDGVVYISGRTLVDGKSPNGQSASSTLEMNGSMIVKGRALFGISPGAANVRLRYDASIVDRLRQTAGKYRKRRARSPQ